VVCCSPTETRSQLHKHQTVDDDFEELEVGKIKLQASLLTEDDARYAGRRVSRKDIEEQISATGVFFVIIIIMWIIVFTVRCYAEHSYEIACRLSVTFRYRDHIGWNTSKTISRRNSLRLMRLQTPTWAIWCKGDTPKISVE